MLAHVKHVAVMRWSLGVLAAGLIALAPSSVWAQGDAGVRQVVAEIQRMRAEAGLPAFIEDEALGRAAARQSAEMADSGRLTHVSPRTGNPSTRVTDEGLHPQRVAENVARGSDLAGAQASIVGSRAHRAQLLDAELTHLGVAAAVSSDGSVYLTEVMARLPVAEVPAVTPPAPSALPPPALDPAPAQPAVSQIAPAQPAAPSSAQALAPPITPGARQVAGYWVLSRGHWYYYPLPPGAQPGQQLIPDLSVQGPPPSNGTVVTLAPTGIGRPPVAPREPMFVPAPAYGSPRYAPAPYAPRRVVRPRRWRRPGWRGSRGRVVPLPPGGRVVIYAH